MITVHGVAPSRTYRCLWLLEELGLEYERELVHWDDEGEKRSAYLELNPNGRVPCLVDGDLVLFESLAINLYLIRRYGGSLAPNSIEDEGRRTAAERQRPDRFGDTRYLMRPRDLRVVA